LSNYHCPVLFVHFCWTVWWCNNNKKYKPSKKLFRIHQLSDWHIGLKTIRKQIQNKSINHNHCTNWNMSFIHINRKYRNLVSEILLSQSTFWHQSSLEICHGYISMQNTETWCHKFYWISWLSVWLVGYSTTIGCEPNRAHILAKIPQFLGQKPINCPLPPVPVKGSIRALKLPHLNSCHRTRPNKKGINFTLWKNYELHKTRNACISTVEWKTYYSYLRGG
jgi:hypothetical protein